MKHSTAGQSERIQELQVEAARECRRTAADLITGIMRGEIARSAGNLLFHTSGRDFRGKLERLLGLLAEAYTDNRNSTDACGHILSFLVTLILDLQSFLPRWVLSTQLAAGELERSRDQVLELLEDLSARDAEPAGSVHRRLREQTECRLRVEGLDESRAGGEAEKLAGDLLPSLARNREEDLGFSNILRVALSGEEGRGHRWVKRRGPGCRGSGYYVCPDRENQISGALA